MVLKLTKRGHTALVSCMEDDGIETDTGFTAIFMILTNPAFPD